MLRAIFNIAVKWGYLRESPTKNVTRLSGMDAKKPRFLTLEETSSSNIAQKNISLFQIALWTGMKTGELRHLECLLEERDKIKVKQKDSFLPKTQKSVREIPMDRKLKTILKKLKDCSDNTYVFPNQNGKLYEKRGIYTIFKRIIKRAGLSDVTVHDLRDTFASHLIMKGVDLRTVQELLGHSSIQTTIRHYAHLTSAHLDEAVKKLPY